MKSDEDSINEFIYSRSSICYLESDYLAKQFFSKRGEIPIKEEDDMEACFSQLGSNSVGAFFVSASAVKSFFKTNEKYNNKYDFISRDSIYAEFSLLIRKDLPSKNQIQTIIKNTAADTISKITKQYYVDPKFEKILPSSIFSDSILLIYTCMTITSCFIIGFLIIMIYKLRKRPFDRKKLKLTNHGEKKFDQKRKKKYTSPRDYEDEEDAHHIPKKNLETEGYDTVHQTNKAGNKNKTLSLSGPMDLRRFDGKPEKSWLKIDAQSSKEEGSFKFHGTSDFENQISSVEKAHEESMPTPRDIFNVNSPEQEEHENRNRIRLSKQKNEQHM